MKSGLHITEGVSGRFLYHLSEEGTNSTALCGAQTMYSGIPLSSWGVKGHLNEKFCAECSKELTVTNIQSSI